MLFVDLELPDGALLPKAAQPADPGGIVFDANDLINEGRTATNWSDRSGAYSARPSKPNVDHATLDQLGTQRVLNLTKEKNCGFALEDLTLSTPSLSMAVMFATPLRNARTLVTVNPQDGQNYLFLNEFDGEVTLKFRKGELALSQPNTSRQGAFSLVCATIIRGVLKLAVNGAPFVSGTEATGFAAGSFDLFIGCRSDRAGIPKTLGEAQVARVWIWPDRDVFADDTYEKLVARWQQDMKYDV